MRTEARRLDILLAQQGREQAGRLALAAAAAVAVGVSAVLLLGLSGWFITGSALAGAGGLAMAHAFNALLPSAGIRLLAIVRTGARYAERVSGHEAALKALARIRPALFIDLASAPPARAMGLASGEASARFIQDVDALQTLFIRRSSVWTAGAGAAAAVLMAGLASPLAAGEAFVGMGLAAAGSWWIGVHAIDPLGRRRQIAMGAFKSRLSAHEGSAAELRAYGLEAWAVADAMRRADVHDRLKAQVDGSLGRMALWQASISALTLLAVTAAASTASLPLVALAILATVTGLEAVGTLAVGTRDAGAARESRLRLSDLVQPAPTGAPAPCRVSDGRRLAPGDRLGVTGPSGGGKTTCIERLMGLRTGPVGLLSIAGVPEDGLDLNGLRRLFSYAAQHVQLIDGSVGENLRIAAPEAPDADLWRALDDAGLAERIAEAPGGLDAAVGQDGMGLSGGERRRLTLARAYLRPAPWLVLDEPTEGLDSTTERIVLDGLERRLVETGQGLILVSHRPAPLRLCDQHVTIEGVGVDGVIRVARSDTMLAASGSGLAVGHGL